MSVSGELRREPSYSIKCGELLDWQRYIQLLKNDCLVELGVSFLSF
jgi:hypothetical protein